MASYTLDKITVKNFKLFGVPFSVNFSDATLTVFDGPNGYGKTSVFDAIELGLTGTIKRFFSVENRQIPADVVVAHNGNANVEVVLQLKGERSLTVIRRLKEKWTARATKTDNFAELWDLFVVDGDNETRITEDGLCTLIGNPNLARDYHLLHYVQQEETAHFLKSNKEHQRAEALSSLFGDTKEAEDDLEKLELVLDRLKQISKALNAEKLSLETRYDISTTTTTPLIAAPSHTFLLPWLQSTNRAPEWDCETIPDLSPNKKIKIDSELALIKSFYLHKDLFLSSRVYKIAAQQKEVIANFIQYQPFIDERVILRRKAEINSLILFILDLLKNGKAHQIQKNENIIEILMLAGHHSPDDFFASLAELLDARKRDDGLSTLYLELVRYRAEMEKRHQAIGPGKQCPFCGADYESSASLLHAIIATGEQYQALISDQGKKLQSMEEEFERGVIQPLVDLLTSYQSTLNPPTTDFMVGIEGAEKMSGRLANLYKWLVVEGIDFSDILAGSPSLLSEVEQERRCQILAGRILSKSPAIDEKYLEADGGGGFERVFSTYFDRSPESVVGIPLEAIDHKLAYIDHMYFGSLALTIERHKNICAMITDISAKSERLKAIRTTILKEIKSYQLKLITDVEIPFYLFSGKILQSHQAGIGNGVFIKDATNSEQLKNVRLVSDWRTDHDILNTMSSGQIAAVVIALSLSLNKVYCKSLKTILIDDPVQTMDDINMISLVELLRNEFCDSQIIVSTHEEDVSRYLLYKFLKHGHRARKINLMERKEYTLST